MGQFEDLTNEMDEPFDTDELDDRLGVPGAAEVFKRDGEPTRDIETLCSMLDNLRLMKKRLEEDIDKIKQDEADIEATLFGVLESEGFQSVKTAIGTFYRYSKLHASVNKDHEAKFFEWLETVDAASLAKKTVHHKALSSFIKERKENGLFVPDYVNVHMPKKIGIRK